MSGLRLPWLRDELLQYVNELADVPSQTGAWAASRFDAIAHFFVDDYPDAMEWIGEFLHDTEEAEVVSRLQDALEVLLAKNGKEPPDPDYLATPEWRRVIAAATDALPNLMRREHARTTS